MERLYDFKFVSFCPVVRVVVVVVAVEGYLVDVVAVVGIGGCS